MSPSLAIVVTGVLVATSCSLLGTFLVLRRMAMMTDAITHAVLPGLVLGYAVAGGPNLALAFLGAALSSLVLVTLVDRLARSGRVDSQAAIGVSFSAMFALGTFLVTKFFSDVHLDTDAVLYGNIEFVGFDRLFLGDTDLGPRSVWVMGGLCLLNLAFVVIFAKELELTTFDPALASALGFAPVLVHYALMALVSVTAVGAFTAVGAILVVALMVVPAATALLLTVRLHRVIVLSALLGAAAAVSGYLAATALDTSVSGMMATMTGVFFGLALLVSPRHGVLARRRRSRRARAALMARLAAAPAGASRPGPAVGAIDGSAAYSRGSVLRGS